MLLRFALALALSENAPLLLSKDDKRKLKDAFLSGVLNRSKGDFENLWLLASRSLMNVRESSGLLLLLYDVI